MRTKSRGKKRKGEASNESNSAAPGMSVIVDADTGHNPRLGGQFAGYIFMCNAQTKTDCFIYRVFGLPASRIDVVEQIKVNAKLFLFDVDVKLLYGPYVADSVGKLSLEPDAFGGRFPAQVKFSIAEDCLPLPESTFKDAIKENYLSKTKFKLDLSYEQVDKLVSLFRPITVQSPDEASLAAHSLHGHSVPDSKPNDVLQHLRKAKARNETVSTAPTSDVTADADTGHNATVEGQFAGFIFTCNSETKPECFKYRVFGLPAWRIGVVEKIKPNAKLFLFDVDLKLLYGPYVADSIGKLALEPYAFGGRFPAQVKFSITNDCLPLPEAAFKDAIKENYHFKSKFKQDLSYDQVNKLISLFNPVTLQSPHQMSLAAHQNSTSEHSLHGQSVPGSKPNDVLQHPRKVEASNETKSTARDSTFTLDAEIRQNPRLGEQFAGYIFMCSAQTKSDCFTYKVFGLPASRIHIVEKIKPNAKLFLFDFDVKLLYGPYVADSVGKLALEPHAFGGRFPAQVRFSIAKDCFPLPEAAFKGAIKENYLCKSKFKPDLSYEQVDKLMSLFCPITLRSPHQASPSFLTAAYHPDDPSFQRHYTHLLSGQGINPVVPPVPPANEYHGQNIRHLSTVSRQQLQAATPSPVIQLPSLPAARRGALAARPYNLSDETFNTSFRNGPEVSHGNNLQNVSNYTDPGYGYSYQVNPGTHEASVGPTEQPVHAYERHLATSNRFYTRSDGDPALAHTLQSGSSGVGTINAYSYGHGYQQYSGLAVYQEVSITHASASYGNHEYLNSQVYAPQGRVDPKTGYTYENEGYSGHYQTLPATSEQGASNLGIQAYAENPTSISSN